MRRRQRRRYHRLLREFFYHPGRNDGTLTLNSSTVTSNSATGTSSGGGIRNDGTLTLNSSTVSNNTAFNGGGIFNTGLATATLTNTTVSGNMATGAGGDGGGIDSGGMLTLDNSTVSGNTATNDGGGIGSFSPGTVTLTDSTVSDNTATNGDGGGISNGGTLNGGTLTLTGSTVGSGNSAADDGGGIFNSGTGMVTLNSSTVSGNTATNEDGGGIINRSSATATLTNSTVSNNMATGAGGDGGGFLNAGALTLTSSTVSGNMADDDGGGIYNTSGGTATLTSSTVSGNTAPTGGGIINFGAPASVAVKNTIVANSVSGSDCNGAITSNGNNLDSDASCALGGAGDISNTNPQLGPLADNGGTTQTHALLGGSPAIDAGLGCPLTDQRGVFRPQGPDCDIGAYEAGDADADGIGDALDPCPLVAEDLDGFQDADGCPDPDNDLDGICDPGQTSVSCTGSDFGKSAFFPPGHDHGDPASIDCRNVPEDIDGYQDADGCPEPDNDNDGFPDITDDCPGTDIHAGADGALGPPEDSNHNGVSDGGESALTTDDVVMTFEDYDGIIDTDGCHDSPGDDFDGDGWPDEVEVLSIGTDPRDGCPDNSGDNANPADFNNDASFTGFDLSAVAADIGMTAPPADARKDIAPLTAPDGQITGADLSAVAARIGQMCPPP